MPILATVGLRGVASRWITVLVAVLAVAFLVHPAAGRADTPVLPSNLGLPSSDPAHQGPLEQLLARIASHIAGRPVTVRCEGDHDWSVLAAQQSFDPSVEAGYVDFSRSLATNRFVSSATTMELSPGVCSYLQSFAQASVKPTKCQASTASTAQVTRFHVVTRYRVVTLSKPTVIDGRLLKPGVWKISSQVKAPYTVAQPQNALNPPAPCFLGTSTTSTGVCWRVPTASGTREDSCYDVTARPSGAYWSDYSAYASALATVAHEAIHLWQVQAGAVVPADSLIESQATCSSMQWLPYVATQLGDTSNDAQAIADFYWKVRYPSYRSLTDAYSKTRPYWSADCRAGGALDIRSDKNGLWP
jgi:hypothetical protein